MCATWKQTVVEPSFHHNSLQAVTKSIGRKTNDVFIGVQDLSKDVTKLSRMIEDRV